MRDLIRAFIARHLVGPDLWGGELSTLDQKDGLS